MISKMLCKNYTPPPGGYEICNPPGIANFIPPGYRNCKKLNVMDKVKNFKG